jgi:general secretion pathway protein I
MRSSCADHAGGFTLIEVLVALAIIAFGLVAVFGQMGQSATAANRLRDKSLAGWVALNRIAELRLAGQYPGVGTQSDEVEMADVRWRYEVRISETEGDYLRRADVSVARADAPDRPVVTVVGFIARPTPPAAGGSWPRLDQDGQVIGGQEDAGADESAALTPDETPVQPTTPDEPTTEGGETAAEQ